MSAHENGNRPSIGKITRRGIARHYDEISKAAFVQLLIRAAVVAPFLFCKSLGGPLPDLLAALAGAAVYVFLLIPMRFWAKQKVRRVFYRHGSNKRKENIPTTYHRWLSTGLLRYLRGFLWGLPFCLCVAYFTVMRSVLDAKTFNAPIHWLAMLLAGNPEDGLGNVSLAWGLIGGLICLFGLLFAYGWWRDLPFEYLPVRSIGTTKTLHWSRRILKKRRKEMFGNTCVNILLSLPAILGFGAVLGMYMINKVNFSLSMDMVLAQLKNLLTQPVPQLVLLELLGVFAVLYLPFCIWRKCRNAALMARCIRPHAHSIASDAKPVDEKADEEKPEENPKQAEKPEEPSKQAEKPEEKPKEEKADDDGKK